MNEPEQDPAAADALPPLDEHSPAEPDEGESGSFDAAKINTALSEHLRHGTWTAPAFAAGGDRSGETPTRPDPVAEHLEELAEDMLDLLSRVRGIETTQADVSSRLAELEKTVRDRMFLQAREVDALRREL